MTGSPASREPLWTQRELNNPHTVADKARRVEAMFAAIAPSYDLNNRIHSMWRDQAWRRAAVAMARVQPTDVVVDVACGTGDLSLAFAQGGAAKVVGIDFTFNMLAIAHTKPPPARRAVPSYHAGDAMRLPLADDCADVVSIAFGIRNVAQPALAMAEFLRVLRPGGRVVVLEFGLPTHPLMRGLYNFYTHQVMPRTATWIAGDRSGAYKYLPRSVNTFMDRAAMLDLMGRAGLKELQASPLTMGIAVIYCGVK